MLKRRKVSLTFAIFTIFTLMLIGCGSKKMDVDVPSR